MTVLEGLKPEKVFYFFEKLCEIPHGSTNMKEISDYLVSFAKERNLKYYQDEAYNVVLRPLLLGTGQISGLRPSFPGDPLADQLQ